MKRPTAHSRTSREADLAKSNTFQSSRKVRSRSGCRTCRLRKVKCDECRPACQRCTSTGRACEGYGIWGGGTQQPVAPTTAGSGAGIRSLLLANPSFCPFPLQPADRSCLEWFMCWTIKKLPGSFSSDFWETRVLRVAFSEPAVLHAVLALGSLHKRDVLGGQVLATDGSALDREERFMLQHYSKAIGHLAPRRGNSGEISVRTALVSCLVFVCLELLQGHNVTARFHLEGGLHLIGETYGSLGAPGEPVITVRPTGDRTNNAILKAFSTISVQVELFRLSTQARSSIQLRFEPEVARGSFETAAQAKERLDYLVNEALRLREGSEPQHIIAQPTGYVPSLGRQQRVLSDLAAWLAAYKNSTATLKPDGWSRAALSCRLMRVNHTMAEIIAATALEPDSDSVFDIYTDHFSSITTQVLEIVRTNGARFRPKEERAGQSPFTADMGWIPPLYYTALKCRDARIRALAVSLLDWVPHREATWDAQTAASHAQKAMDVRAQD